MIAIANRYRISTAYMVGLIDASVCMSYMLGITAIYWHVLTVFAKLLVYAYLTNRKHIIEASSGYFVLGLAALCVGSALLLRPPGDFVQIFGFSAEFILSLLIVKGATRSYLSAASLAITLFAVLHILQCLGGGLISTLGRFPYFSGSHPNLGGELAAAAAFGAALCHRKPVAILFLFILLVDSLLMQSRAAIIAIAVMLFALFVFDKHKRLSVNRFYWVAAIISAFLVLGLVSGYLSFVIDAVNSALLLSDAGRGIGSGASGRSELWAFSLKLFLESPLIGHGLGYFDEIDFVGSHNTILFAMAQSGLVGLMIVSLVLVKLWYFSRLSLFNLSLSLAIMVLFMFNDRFININAYPFCIYVFLFSSNFARTSDHIRVPMIKTLSPGDRGATNGLDTIHAKG